MCDTLKKAETTDWKDVASRMANEHWGYIQSLLVAHSVEQYDIDVIEFHYVSSFEHGFKHALEYMEGSSGAN